MRILFVGTVKFSLDALQCIWQENAQIVGVITQSSSGSNSDFVKIKPFCQMYSNAIYNLVRSLSKPYVGAHLVYKGQEIKIWNSREVFSKPSNIEPGRVTDIVDDGIIVTCYDNSIWLEISEFSELPAIGETI